MEDLLLAPLCFSCKFFVNAKIKCLKKSYEDFLNIFESCLDCDKFKEDILLLRG